MNKTIRSITTAFALTFAALVGSSALAATPAQIDANPIEHVDPDTNDGDRFDAAVTLEGKVNINTASAAELELLPGIGPSIAVKIVSYRQTHKFEQPSNITRVQGIGQKTFAKIKDFVTVEGTTTLRVAK
jgi:competence protein ComEA